MVMGRRVTRDIQVGGGLGLMDKRRHRLEVPQIRQRKYESIGVSKGRYKIEMKVEGDWKDTERYSNVKRRQA